MQTAKDILKAIKDKDVKYVDFRFTDSARQVAARHLRHRPRRRGAFADGTMFDGSSIAGWKAINECDMKLHAGPDDRASSTRSSSRRRCRSSATCSNPATGEPYNRDPRSIAKKARSLREVHRHRRHRLSSAPKPSSSSSTT